MIAASAPIAGVHQTLVETLLRTRCTFDGGFHSGLAGLPQLVYHIEELGLAGESQGETDQTRQRGDIYIYIYIIYIYI